jgi:hypothetical protein
MLLAAEDHVGGAQLVRWRITPVWSWGALGAALMFALVGCGALSAAPWQAGMALLVLAAGVIVTAILNTAASVGLLVETAPSESEGAIVGLPDGEVVG